ncbi:hypothetical protein BKA93DRAFT_816166 [Sparassis latifolia]
MPSDSVSHRGGTISQDSSIVSPPVLKKTYPFTVLWNKEDCKKDDDVHITVANPERIPMDQAIRHENEWHTIQTTARVVKNELLSLPPPRDRRYHNIKRTKKVFKAAYPREWEAAMLKMEKQQPLLALCSDHWKAEYIIGPMLLQQHKPDSELDNDDDDVSHISTSTTNTRASEHEGRTSGPVATPALEPQLSLTSAPAIDISFINVDPSIENLIDALSSSHPDLISGLELLNSMKLTFVFDIGSPTSEVITFIERIESADPNSPDLLEDDLGTAWGHYQFTAGSMTSSSTLVSWDGIGSEAA